MISEWRSIRPVEINRYDITMATHYDITMGNDIARDAHCEIAMDNDIARDIHCDITLSNDIAMCTCHGIIIHNDVAMNLFYYVFLYHGITMHNDVPMNLFYCVFSALCLIMILLWVVCNKNKKSSCLIILGWRTHSLFLCMAISPVLQTREISLHKHNSCVLPRLIKYSLVCVIISSINTRGQQCTTEMKCIGKPLCLTKLIHKLLFL